MHLNGYPIIDLTATGDNIKRLRIERGLTVRDLQKYFGFEEPQAIYKWQRGQSLPTVDNLYALGNLLGITMDEILVPVRNQLHTDREQQGGPCCSHLFSLNDIALDCRLLYDMAGCFRYDKLRIRRQPFFLTCHSVYRKPGNYVDEGERNAQTTDSRQ